MKKSQIDRAVERLEEQKRVSEAHTAGLQAAINALRVEVASRIPKAPGSAGRQGRKPKIVKEDVA